MRKETRGKKTHSVGNERTPAHAHPPWKSPHALHNRTGPSPTQKHARRPTTTQSSAPQFPVPGLRVSSGGVQGTQPPGTPYRLGSVLDFCRGDIVSPQPKSPSFPIMLRPRSLSPTTPTYFLKAASPTLPHRGSSNSTKAKGGPPRRFLRSMSRIAPYL